MIIALLSDIHGNIEALSSVVKDARTYEVDTYVFLGDLVFLGLYPKECFELLMNLSPMILIKGNTDANIEGLDSFVPTNSIEKYLSDIAHFTYHSLDEASRIELSSWPIAHSLNIEGKNFIFSHGSPYSFHEQLLPHGETSEKLTTLLQHEKAECMFAGHTHMRGDFFVGKMRVINPGAVGYSFDGTHGASYAIIDITKHDIHVEMRTVAYNQEHYIGELIQKSREFPLFESVLYALRNGKAMPHFREYFTAK